MKNMAKLKTLKDINSKAYAIDYNFILDLRAEAVKWIKEIYYVGTDDKNSEENIKHADAVKVWIKHFFNITDAELK